MAGTDDHVGIARAELDLAIAKLNTELATTAAKTNSFLSRLGPQHLASVADAQDSSGLAEQLIHLNISLISAEAKSKYEALVRKASTFISNLVPLVTVALGILGQVADLSAMGAPVAAITNGTCFLLGLVAKERERKQQFMSELDRISYQARRAYELQRHPEHAIIPLMREKCLALFTAIVNFLRGALSYLGHSTLTQVGKSLFRGVKVWQECIEKLHSAYEEYDQALLQQIASTLIAHSKRSAVQLTDDTVFRNWLAPSASECDAKLTANRVQRANGTLQWVLDIPEFRDWRLGDASNAAKTLWLSGLPGAGKSTISAYLVDILTAQYPEDIVLNFFCKRGAPGLTSCFAMVRTLCYQLTSQEPFYRKFLQKMPDLPTGGAKEDLTFVFDTLLKNPLTSGPRDKTVFILLDGLDELEDTTPSSTASASYQRKTEIEIVLEQLVTLPRTKLLITSRRISELHTILSSSGTVRPITQADNAADIEKYVAHRIEKSTNLRSGFGEMNLEPIAYFSSRANGVFLWVSVVLDVLDRAPSSKTFRQALDEVHPTMDGIYQDIFARAAQRGSLDLMLEVLHWTVILPKPFTVQQMAIATEISLGDKVLDMETFLKTECGALLDLVPILGSGTNSDASLEIHIGHETFQAWLADKFGPQSSRAAHARAARTCLVYMLGKQENGSLRLHAITRWRWHLRQSLGIPDHQLAEPTSALEGGHPVASADALEIFGLLHKYLSGPETEGWLDYTLSRNDQNDAAYWEVHNTWAEVAAWVRTNRDALSDAAIDQLWEDKAPPYDLKAWRDRIDDKQTIAGMLWPRVCHAWLWNSSRSWWSAYRAVDTLHMLWLHADNGADKDAANYTTLEAVKTAGSFDDMSGSCAANVSIFLYAIGDHDEKALTAIQEAIDEDPEGSPRNYFHQGKIYEILSYNARTNDGNKVEADRLASLSLQAYRAAVERDPHHLTDARREVYQTEEDALRAQSPPALDAAVALLERAIADDPANAGNQWFHHLFDVHKSRGDLAAARDTYKRLIAFDQTWHTYWESIADTWIDEVAFEERRTFDWRSWCDALIEAARENPSYAHHYWYHWASKAKTLAGYQAYEISSSILRYGVDSTAAKTDKYARDACATFYFGLGKVLCMKGDWDEAVVPLEEALARSKELDVHKNRDALKYLAWAYMALRRWDDARSVADRRIELPEDPNWGGVTTYDAYSWKGEIALLEGNPAAAVREYKTAVRVLEMVLRQHAGGDPKKMLHNDMAVYLVDLAIVYDRLARPDQALAMFKKALPHVEHVVQKRVEMRTQHETMWRKEGNWRMLLGWVLERLDSSDPRVLENYQSALWVFRKTVYVEDDFVEIRDGQAAEAAVERIRAAQEWEYPGDAAVLDERMRAKIRSLRDDWGNNDYANDIQKPRRRGHS